MGVLLTFLCRLLPALLRPLSCRLLVLLLLLCAPWAASALLSVRLPLPLFRSLVLLDAVQLPYDLLVQVEVAVHHSQTHLTPTTRGTQHEPSDVSYTM